MHAEAANGAVHVRLTLEPGERGLVAMDERNRLATVQSLRGILEPRNVAVIGVSRRPRHLGRRVFDAIIRGGFTGVVYPVNPSATEIDGRQCYPTVGDLPLRVDLAIVVAPRTEVVGIIDECAAAGVMSVVVISAGFAETGEAGRQLQDLLLQKVRGHGMRLVGPNCMGVINASPRVRLNASFVRELPQAGRIALASQSGGVGLALLQLAAVRHLGISTFVSLGNKADVSGNDLLQWSESDSGTSVVLLYLESFGNPRRFAQLARRASRRKPIVVVKSGRTASGSRAAGSHTAGLASNEAAVKALFRQTGVIRADTIEEMADVAQCLDLQPLPAGPRVGIVTNTGGPGILAADACEAAGLTVVPFGADTKRALGAHLSEMASISNPIDLVASAGPASYEHAIVTTLTSADIDSLLVVYTPVDQAQISAVCAAIGAAVFRARGLGVTGKPVLASMLGVPSEPLVAGTGTERIPAYAFPESAAKALGRAAAYAKWGAQPPSVFRTFEDVQVEEGRRVARLVGTARGEAWLTAEERARLLRAFGLHVWAGSTALTEEEAVNAASILGYPVVLKVQSPRILHKTETGGVRLHLQDADAVRLAFRDLMTRFRDALDGGGIEVQPMFTGVETIVGLTQDRVFGPLVAFGLGGIETEVLRDVAFRIAPLSVQDADDLLRDVRVFTLLEGHRGRPRADVDALRELLLRVSLMAEHVPELLELDLNPVIVLPAGQGCRIVDARARVAGPPGPSS
jgi:acetyl coenzyme A synthetase (ADP forming)-like protein